jgi:plasmid stability protein
MPTLTIRNLDDPLKARLRLRLRAAMNGRSMEAEARDILNTALGAMPAAPGNLGEAIQTRFAPYGGVELEPLPRETDREPPSFD